MENRNPNEEVLRLEEKLQSALDEISSLRRDRDGFAAQIRKFVPCASPEEEAAFRFELQTALPGGLLDMVEAIERGTAG